MKLSQQKNYPILQILILHDKFTQCSVWAALVLNVSRRARACPGRSVRVTRGLILRGNLLN